MKKGIFLGFCLFCLISFSINAQETAMVLDTALQNSASYIAGRISNGSKVVILNFKTKYIQLADYIIDELTTYIVNDGKLKAVDRQNLELIRKEMDFQLSGEVSDESAQSIGRKLGAQTIISGEIAQIGDVYRLRVRAISVETAEIQGMQNVNIIFDQTLAALTGSKKVSTKTAEAEEWKNKWLYIGAWGGMATDSYDSGFAFGAQIDVQLAKIFSIRAEAGSDSLWQVYPRVGLFGNLTFRPSIVDIGVYAGAIQHFDDWGGWLSFAVGGNIGVKLGPGVLFIDVCDGDVESSLFTFGIGYKLGLINKQ
jgi:TolB-like protein